MNLTNNFISWLIRHIPNLDYPDFGLGDETAKVFERREMNSVWKEIQEI